MKYVVDPFVVEEILDAQKRLKKAKELHRQINGEPESETRIKWSQDDVRGILKDYGFVDIDETCIEALARYARNCPF